MVSRETPALPEWLEPFRAQLGAFHDLLAGAGAERGLIGPREVDRLWDRHLLNCAVVADPTLPWVPSGARVVDVGSGAGLPGLVWGIVRPDLQVVLLEPLLRRSTFLTEAVADLGVADRVHVQRGRAEEIAASPVWQPADVATARAVASLDKLATWTLPLVGPKGSLVALKGASAEEEVTAAREVLTGLGVQQVEVVACGVGVVDPPTTVVIARRQPA